DASPFLAIAEGEAAGLLLLVFRRRLNFATWEGWVPELVVARTFRGRGIGRALLRVAIEEWRLRGAHRLSVETEPMGDGCAAMLTGLGFEEGLLRFRHDRIAAEGRPPPAGVTLRPIQAADFVAATGEALLRGAQSMTLESGPMREVAHALYRSRGFHDAGRERLLLRDRA